MTVVWLIDKYRNCSAGWTGQTAAYMKANTKALALVRVVFEHMASLDSNLPVLAGKYNPTEH